MRSFKVFLFLTVAALCCLSLFAQVKPAGSNTASVANLKKQAADMSDAFNAGQFERFSTYTYPKVLEGLGGKAGLVTLLEKQVQEWKKQDIVIKAVSVGEPSKIVKAGTELHALISQKLVMNVKGGTLTSNSTLLSISPDNGTKWYFLDTAPLNETNLKQVFPNFNKALVLPAKQKPVFTPDP